MVGLHANALNTILNNDLSHEVGKLLFVLVILLIGLLLAFGVHALTPAQGGAATEGILIGYLSFVLVIFKSKHLDHLFGPMLTLVLGYLGITVYNYIWEEKNKQFLKDLFGTYVSPELIDQMYESGEEGAITWRKEGYHTAFFTDIQSFSAFSEKIISI